MTPPSDPTRKPLTLYNTLTKSHEPFTPADPGRVTFYTCGPTVYDDAHIGNFRAFLVADLLRRWLESPLCTLAGPDGSPHAGPRTVRHVMNITDVGHMTDDAQADGGGEDKMQAAAKRLLEAKKAGTAHAQAAAGIDNPNDPRQIAEFYTQRFLEDAEKLGLTVAIEAKDNPDRMPRASDNVEGPRGMVGMIEDLAEKGFAYRPDRNGTPGNAVYFDVQKHQSYGRLSGNTLDKLRGGAGGRVDDRDQAAKRHPADFLLWKSDPSHLMKWPGPVIDGAAMPEGYPGWHIECSVMARNAFADMPGRGETIDLHSGGEDNIFPHHECERAQSCCAAGQPEFARHWLHTRFLLVEGEKMAKRKGNFFTARDLFAKGHDPAAVRLELIKTHYRANANFTEFGLRETWARIKRARRKAAEIELLNRGEGDFTPEVNASDAEQILAHEFSMALCDDLNISRALAVLSAATAPHVNLPEDIDVSRLPTKPMPADVARSMLESSNYADRVTGLLHLIDNVLGVIFTPQPKQTDTDIGLFTAGLEPDPAVIDLLTKRRDAKLAKNFAESDRIRDRLAAMGYAIKDVAGGRVEVSRA